MEDIEILRQIYEIFKQPADCQKIAAIDAHRDLNRKSKHKNWPAFFPKF